MTTRTAELVRNPKTMVYTVDLGDGRVVDIEGPEGATPEQLQQVASQHQGATLDNSGTETEFGFTDQLPDQPVSRMSPEDEQAITQMLQNGASAEDVRGYAASKGFQFPNADDVIAAREQTGRVNPDAVYQLPQAPTDAAGSAARGVADTIFAGTLPKVGAAIAGAQNYLNGGDFGDAYGRMLDSNNATIAADEYEHPWMRVAGQILGGFALPAGLEGVGLKAGTDVLRAGGSMADARAAASIAVRNRMAVVGGAYGAAHGAGSQDNLGDAAVGAMSEGALGAATGGLLGQGGRRTAVEERIGQASDSGRDIFEAAQRQGISPLPADVGGSVSRGLTAVAAQTPVGGGQIQKAAERVLSQGQAALSRAASAVGQAADPEAAGEVARAGALSYSKASRHRIGRIYDTAAQMAGNTRIELPKAKAILDEQIARLAAVPGGGTGLDEARNLRASLDGAYSVQGVRDMRTEMFVEPALRGTPVERRLRQVVDAAAEDISDGLRSQGKEQAAKAFDSADRQWKERLTTLKRVIEPVIGRDGQAKSGEEIIAGLERAAKGNGERLDKFISALPSDEARTVRATLIGRLGMAGAGRQNAAGDAFSFNDFLTNWNKIGERAKATIFGPESRAALNDLAKVAEGTKASQKYANFSNTGRVIATVATGASASGGLPTFLTTLAAQYVSGKMLASPAFARWLARASKTSVPTPAYLDRLTRVARAEPAIANDVLGLQSRLTEAFTGSPARLAADERRDEVLGADGNAAQQNGQTESPQP